MYFLLRPGICSRLRVLGFICAFEFPRSLLCNSMYIYIYNFEKKFSFQFLINLIIYLNKQQYIYIHI